MCIPQHGDTSANGNLLLELDAFVGRTGELAGLARALGSSRLVTVTGVGGVGKSRLAAHAAARSAASDGVWRVELAPVRDPEFLDHAVVDALGLTDHTARLPREILLGHLAGRELLLVLDGFEHLVDACAELVTELLRRAPGLRVLAVGRRPLAVAGERVFTLGPLGEDEAAQLFLDRADRQGFALRDDPDVRELSPAPGRHPAGGRAGRGTAGGPVPRAAPRAARRPVPAAHGRRAGRAPPPSDAAYGDRLEP